MAGVGDAQSGTPGPPSQGRRQPTQGHIHTSPVRDTLPPAQSGTPTQPSQGHPPSPVRHTQPDTLQPCSQARLAPGTPTQSSQPHPPSPVRHTQSDTLQPCSQTRPTLPARHTTFQSGTSPQQLPAHGGGGSFIQHVKSRVPPHHPGWEGWV